MECGLTPFCRPVTKLIPCNLELTPFHTDCLTACNRLDALPCALPFCRLSILRGAASSWQRLERLWDALSQTLLLMTLRPAWDTLASGDLYTCIAWDECTSTEALQTPVQQATWQRKGHAQPCLTVQSLPRCGFVSGSWCSLLSRELATGESAVSTGNSHAIS